MGKYNRIIKSRLNFFAGIKAGAKCTVRSLREMECRGVIRFPGTGRIGGYLFRKGTVLLQNGRALYIQFKQGGAMVRMFGLGQDGRPFYLFFKGQGYHLIIDSPAEVSFSYAWAETLRPPGIMMGLRV